MSQHNKDLTFYSKLWLSLVGTEFAPQKLADRARVDGGIDITNLSESDVLALIEGHYSGSWEAAAFSFSEMLSSYSVPGGIESSEQIVGWVFASFMVADAARQEVIDWELLINIFLDGFFSVRDKFEAEEVVYIFQRIFGCD